MGDEGRRPFPNEGGGAPAAASVSRRGPGSGRGRAMPDAISGVPIETLDGDEPDYEDELEGPPEFPGCRPGTDPEGDERRRLERLSAPPAPKPEVSEGERAALVRGCYDGILANWMVHGAGDLMVRELAALLGITPEEADALAAAEIARRSAPPATGE